MARHPVDQGSPTDTSACRRKTCVFCRQADLNSGALQRRLVNYTVGGWRADAVIAGSKKKSTSRCRTTQDKADNWSVIRRSIASLALTCLLTRQSNTKPTPHSHQTSKEDAIIPSLAVEQGIRQSHGRRIWASTNRVSPHATLPEDCNASASPPGSKCTSFASGCVKPSLRTSGTKHSFWDARGSRLELAFPPDSSQQVYHSTTINSYVTMFRRGKRLGERVRLATSLLQQL